MVMPGVLQFLRRRAPLRRYHSSLRERMAAYPLFQMLPPLIHLPLFSIDGCQFDAAAPFRSSPAVALCGPVGSGRSLALAQIAWHWARKEQSTPVLPLPLAQVDNPALAPRTVVATLLSTTGLPLPLESHMGAASRQPWVLLVDEWETLPPARRADWRAFLLSLPSLWPGAQVVLSLPNTGETWGNVQVWNLASPDQERRELWLSRLLPNHDPTPLQEALQAGAPLDTLGQRLRDLVLLALSYPHDGVPDTRAQLYQRARVLLRNANPNQHQHGSNGHHPTEQHLDTVSTLSPLRHYDMARDIAGANDPTMLSHLEPTDRAEVGLLLAGLLPDPQPVLRQLWQAETASDLFSLVVCFRERPAHIPAWGVEVLEVVAAQTMHGPGQHMLALLAPVLPDLFKAASDALEEKRLCLLLARVAPLLDTPALLALLDDGALRAALRWTVVDVLLQQVAEVARLLRQASPPPDELSCAARGYMLALGSSADRRYLAEHTDMRVWVAALYGERVSNERRLQVAQTLLYDPATPDSLRQAAMTLLPDANDETTLALLKRVGVDHDPTIRQTALEALHARAPHQSLDLLSSIMLRAESSWEAQRDALEQVASCHTRAANALLVRGALGTVLPLAGRGRALVLLAQHTPAAAALLLRLVPMETLPPLLRAVALRLLAQGGTTSALPALCRVAVERTAPALVRQAAVGALGYLGQHAAVQAAVLEGLQAAFASAGIDTALKVAVLRAVGTIATPKAIPLLRAILERETFERVRIAWCTLAPALETAPSDTWQAVAMPEEARLVLLDACSAGGIEAENPTSFKEFIEQAVSQVRLAAVDALVRVGQSAAPEAPAQLRPALQGMLFALLQDAPPYEMRPILAAIAQLSSTNGSNELRALLGNQMLDPMIRWLAVERLGAHPASEPVLIRALHDQTLDPFIKGHIALMLGQHQTSQAMLALRTLAGQTDAPAHMRTQAILALSPIADPIATETLLAVVMDSSALPALRGTAARALPPDLATETRRWFRDVLHREQEPPDLVIGVLAALGRARDQEALVHILRYAQSEQSAVALAALEAIASIGDSSVAPTLVRISQSTVFAEPVRLHAVIALLRLCGAEYLPFLRRFLDSAVLPLQLQALDCLLSLWPDDSHTMVLVANQDAPLVLRLRALEEVGPDSVGDHLPTLCSLLLNQAEAPSLRRSIAVLLGRTGRAEAVEALTACLYQPDTPIPLQRRCGESLALLARAGGPGAALAHYTLGVLAEDMALSAAVRLWAGEALCHLLVAHVP